MAVIAIALGIAWLAVAVLAVLMVADALDTEYDNETWWMAATAIAFAAMWIIGPIGGLYFAVRDQRKRRSLDS